MAQEHIRAALDERYLSFMGRLQSPSAVDDGVQFRSDTGLGRIGLAGCFLGSVLGFHVCLCIYAAGAPDSVVLLRWSIYAIFLSLFHLLEFVLTATFKPKTLTYDSFLLNHSKAYTVAALASWTEFWLEALLWQSSKEGIFWMYVGLVLVAGGQATRTLAMHTAGSNFNHIVQERNTERHRLVTTGAYAVLRHPAYFGWFWWSVGTQVLLGNPVCVVAYGIASWRFFRARIPHEELTLRHQYGKVYNDYCARTIIGIPFIY